MARLHGGSCAGCHLGTPLGLSARGLHSSPVGLSVGLLGLLQIGWLNLRCERKRQWKLPVSYSIGLESGTGLLLLDSIGDKD